MNNKENWSFSWLGEVFLLLVILLFFASFFFFSRLRDSAKLVFKIILVILGLPAFYLGVTNLECSEPYPFLFFGGLAAFIYGIVASTKYGFLCGIDKNFEKENFQKGDHEEEE